MEPEFDGLEWDEDKRQACLSRGIDFAAAEKLFRAPHLHLEDRRDDYGEPRYYAIGEIDGDIVTFVWTPRENRRRIITAWPATARQEREYYDHCKKNQ